MAPLRCFVCGGPAFSCKCVAVGLVNGYAAEVQRCDDKLIGLQLSRGERAIWVRQREAARGLLEAARRELVAVFGSGEVGSGAPGRASSTRTMEMFS